MALKVLMRKKELTEKQKQLLELRKVSETFATREVDLEKAIEEAATEEEKAAVEEAVEAFDKEKDENEKAIAEAEEAAADIESEIEELERSAPTGTDQRNETKENEKREGVKLMNTRKFFGMAPEQRDAFLSRDEVKDFLQRTRDLGAQVRGVAGADLLIPEIMLDLLRENIPAYSKLITKVNLKPLKGTARQNITGTVPEAVWTEMVGALNELEISFNQVEVDGYKVGGFIAIPNSTLQDSDLNLANEIMNQLSQAIGKALDKAILFGLGTKQPLGIATRLAQTSKPSDYSDKAPTWVDLHTTNVTKTSATGTALIGAIITAFGACKNDFSNGQKFFAMNSKTYSHLITTLLSFNAAGAIATGMQQQMPILGGDIVILDFMNDYDIVGGYGDLYLLVEREGTVLATSEHVKFIEDMTVTKGLARYDGMPVIAEGFFVLNINNATAATTTTFEIDYANTEIGALGVTSIAGTLSGDTKIAFTGGEVSGTTFAYKVGGKAVNVVCGDSGTGWTVLATGDDITAATGKIITIIELDANNRAIKTGSAQVVAKA